MADRDEAVAALLADSARIFQYSGPHKLSILVTPDAMQQALIRRMVPYEMNLEFVPGSNWMARIIAVEGFREAVLPEMLAIEELPFGQTAFISVCAGRTAPLSNWIRAPFCKSFSGCCRLLCYHFTRMRFNCWSSFSPARFPCQPLGLVLGPKAFPIEQM